VLHRHGCTGTDSDREDFQRLLGRYRRGESNCVIVKPVAVKPQRLGVQALSAHLFVVRMCASSTLELPSRDSYKRPDEITIWESPSRAVQREPLSGNSIKVRGTFNIKRDKGELTGFRPYGYQKDPRHTDSRRLGSRFRGPGIFRWLVLDAEQNGIVLN
jgi:hypothetical protein